MHTQPDYSSAPSELFTIQGQHGGDCAVTFSAGHLPGWGSLKYKRSNGTRAQPKTVPTCTKWPKSVHTVESLMQTKLTMCVCASVYVKVTGTEN